MRMKNRKLIFSILLLAIGALTITISITRNSDSEFSSDEIALADPVQTPYPWPSPTVPVDFEIAPNSVYTFVCETVDQKPKLIFFACADGGEGIEKITWSNWSVNGALGTGTYFRNLCEPSCAEGKYEYSKVDVGLFAPVQMGEKVYLTHISYSPKGKPVDMTSGVDLSEFYRLMNE
ncbi:MAG: hypothetical protein EBY29_11645 [Planctomycetes bacterium]|nr:hypothetical protein [Planctomycetota bacterium]